MVGRGWFRYFQFRQSGPCGVNGCRVQGSTGTASSGEAVKEKLHGALRNKQLDRQSRSTGATWTFTPGLCPSSRSWIGSRSMASSDAFASGKSWQSSHRHASSVEVNIGLSRRGEVCFKVGVG